MTPYYHSSSTAEIPIGHANEYVTSPAALCPTLPPVEGGPFRGAGQHPPTGPSPGLLYAEQDLQVVSQNSMTPPPSYTESSLRLIVGDSKTLPHAYDPLVLSLRNGLSPKHDEGGTSLCVGAIEEPNPLQVNITVLLCFNAYPFSIHTLTRRCRIKAVRP